MPEKKYSPEFLKALMDFQTDCPEFIVDKTNPHFSSKYLSLSGIMKSIRDPLTNHCFILTHSTDPIAANDRVRVTTTMIHQPTGECISNVCDVFLSKVNAQGVGSCITYGRRYGLCSLLGIVADDDDDGNSAVNKQKTNGDVDL